MKQICVFLFFCISQLLPAQPKTEIRAVWLTVNYGLDWPRKPFQNEKDIERQKDELNRILDQLQEIHINMVFFQTRIRGDVIYPSEIESRSEYVKSVYATADYDPLSYAIEACHQRGIECHAWFVVYPLGSEAMNKKFNRTFSAFNRNHLTKTFKKEVYLDPGNPQTDAYILSLIKEIVSTYDIDGIHLDYIRYPEASDGFPDKDTYRLYGAGKNKDDWRRENINRLVYAIYDTVKSLKPWVQVSSSVVGMYKEIQGCDRRHWTAYSSVFQDPVDWLSKGKHDFIVPMNYYSGKLFYPFVQDWVSKSGERFVVPGLGAFQMDRKESGWDASVLYDQVNFSREAKTQGNAFFRAAYILNNSNQFGEGLRSRFYRTPALLPPLTWLSRTVPDTPVSLSAYAVGSFLRLEWDKAPGESNLAVFYNLYRSETFPIDTRDPENLVAVRLTSPYFQLPIDNRIESGYYYAITGFDRYHNESACSKPVYFVTGPFEK
ncbi:MAG: family 10 glycosylhydrolase [Candidatus Azobacteroides sp.]|nr:family 10 glycosylhydrolase [Candidatus Azobacteroides sp.]